MTDDEAFIRAIVDAPGDDAPRLVYADWLDERDDPHGAYLRAEAEWVKAQTRGGRRRIRRAAEKLDPVWVARVSRPPVGVCCAHFRLVDRGPPVSESDVAGFERRHGIALPADYRAFLLNYNGGRLDKSRYGPDGEVMDVIDYVFFPLSGEGAGGTLEAWVERREAFFEREWDPMYGPDPVPARAHFLQFINVGRDPDYIYGIHLGVAGPVRGQVHYFDYSVGFWPGYPEDGPAAAESFAAFLAGLRQSGEYPV